MKLKRFLLFTYDDFYPSGGWNDFKGSFDTLEEAKEARKASSSYYCNIIDTETGEDVA